LSDHRVRDTQPKTADIVIVGAGVMGASIAFHLAQRGAGRIVVVDKEHVAAGGSGRSSALVRMHYSHPAEVKLAVLSLHIFQNWREIVGEQGEFHNTGFVRIVHPGESECLKLNVTMQKEVGANVKLITRDDLREIEPDWNVDDVNLAAYEPDSGYGDGAAVASDFLSRARDLGLTYLPRTCVTSLNLKGDALHSVSTEYGEISTRVAVVATGPWAKPLFDHADYDLPIETEYHQVAILRTPASMKGGGCACIDSVTATYFRPDGADKFLVGDFYGRRPVDPDNFPQRPSEESLAEMIERVVRRVPKLENAEIMRGVTGVYDMTPDSRPLLGEIPGAKGLFVCAGFSGMGFKISPAIGIVMSELLLDGEACAVDIREFRPSRFAEHQPIRAPYEYVDD